MRIAWKLTGKQHETAFNENTCIHSQQLKSGNCLQIVILIVLSQWQTQIPIVILHSQMWLVTVGIVIFARNRFDFHMQSKLVQAKLDMIYVCCEFIECSQWAELVIVVKRKEKWMDWGVMFVLLWFLLALVTKIIGNMLEYFIQNCIIKYGNN